MVSTTSFEEAMEWTLQLYGELNLPRVWIPEKHFIEAVKDGKSISFTRSAGEQLFGVGIGANPPILPNWNEFALPQDLAPEITSSFTEKHRWEVDGFITREMSYEIEPLDDSEDGEFILEFLNQHAPDSSAKPGNPEIILWGAIRNKDGEIASIAAITQWESGEYMLSSVATHSDMRGQGFAQKVSAGLLGLAYDRGIERIFLVALSSNPVALAAYKKVGFQPVGKFVTYSR